MKSLFFSSILVGLTLALAPAQSQAQTVHLGIGYGDQPDAWHHRHFHDMQDNGDRFGHRRHHCRMVQVWHHHHRMLVRECGRGGGFQGGY